MVIKKATGTWSDIRAKLADFDRADLLKVVQGLYTATGTVMTLGPLAPGAYLEARGQNIA